MIKIEEHWQTFLENAKYIIEQEPEFFQGQLTNFKNTFDEDITADKFKELLDQVEPNLHERKD